jgi:hypothetical protein
LPTDNRHMSRRLHKPLWAIAALLLANVVLLLAQPASALTRGLEDFFFGPKLVRAQVILQDAAGVYDYRVDRGRVRNLSADGISLLERDGTLVTIPVSPTAEIFFRGRRVRFAALRRGMTVTTVRLGDAPAHHVEAVPRR